MPPADRVIDLIGVGPAELIAVVGAGGKTTLVGRLGHELAARGRRVVLTTTTKMGADQAGSAQLHPDPLAVSVEAGRPALLLAGIDGHKALGFDGPAVDALFASGRVDDVMVEADGARRRSIKAPEAYEPVVPSSTTCQIALMGVDAVGGVIADTAHRPHRVAALLGVDEGAVLTPERCGRLLTHAAGGRKGAPAGARVFGAITKVGAGDVAVAEEIAAAALSAPGLDGVLVLPPPGGGRPFVIAR